MSINRMPQGSYHWLNSQINSSMGYGVISLGITVAYYNRNLFTVDPIMAVLACILCVVNIWRYFQYIEVLRTELDIVNHVFDEKAIRQFYGHRRIKAIVIVLTSSAMLLVAFSPYIVLHSAASLVYSISDLFGQSLILHNFKNFVAKDEYRRQTSEEFRQAVLDYYFKSPLIPRLGVIFFCYCVSAGLAFWGHHIKNNLYYYAAYGVLLVTFLVSEAVIAYWREKLQQKLESLPDPEEPETAAEPLDAPKPAEPKPIKKPIRLSQDK